VLSFPQHEFPKPLEVLPRARRAKARPGIPDPLGDVVISLPEALANAEAIGHALDREVAFLLVHGILHLCGHDHMVPKDERRMLAAQRQLMGILARKAGPHGKPLWTKCVRKKRARRS
jgi:probable rRNA maturation factor